MSIRRLWSTVTGSASNIGDDRTTFADPASVVFDQHSHFDNAPLPVVDEHYAGSSHHQYHEGEYVDPNTERLRRLLYEVNYAVGPSRCRWDCLSRLAKELEHDDEQRHDDELTESVDLVLYQKLALCLAVDPSSAEVILIASVLERLYDGAGRPAVSASFARIGMAVLPVLMEVVGAHHGGKDAARRTSEDSYDREDDENDEDEDGPPEERKDDVDVDPQQQQQQQRQQRNSLGVSPPAPTSDCPNHYPSDVEPKDPTRAAPLSEQPPQLQPLQKEQDPASTTNDSDSDSPLANPGDMEVDWVRPNIPPEESKDYGDDDDLEPTFYGRDEEPFDDINDHFEDDPTLSSPPVDSPNNSDSSSPSREPARAAIAKMLRVLRYYSRVLSAGVHLASHPGLIDALVERLCDVPPSPPPGQRRHVPEDDDASSSRVDATAVLVNLACAEDNKIRLAEHPGLLDAVVRAAEADPSPKVREHCAVVVMNLSFAPANAQRLAQRHGLLQLLTDTVNDDDPATTPYARRYAAATLFALAPTVVRGGGRRVDAPGVLEALRTVLARDPSDATRVAAAEALYGAAKDHDDDDRGDDGRPVPHPLADAPHMLPTLAEVVVADRNADVRAYTAKALEWTASDVHFDDDDPRRHRALLEALVAASRWTRTDSVAAALRTQASFSRNRAAMAECPGLLDALGELLRNPLTREAALSTVERMSTEEEARPIMARSEAIMTALTRETFRGEDFDGASVVSGGVDGDVDDEVSYSNLMKTALKNLTEHI